MFTLNRYVTRGIMSGVPLPLQLLMWNAIDEKPVDSDYLQVFSLSEENGKHRIVHTQEQPEYQKTYLVDMGCKVFVIDDDTHATMLLASEY